MFKCISSMVLRCHLYNHINIRKQQMGWTEKSEFMWCAYGQDIFTFLLSKVEPDGKITLVLVHVIQSVKTCSEKMIKFEWQGAYFFSDIDIRIRLALQSTTTRSSIRKLQKLGALATMTEFEFFFPNLLSISHSVKIADYITYSSNQSNYSLSISLISPLQ